MASEQKQSQKQNEVGYWCLAGDRECEACTDNCMFKAKFMWINDELVVLEQDVSSENGKEPS
jgi:hypothetical protein